MKLRARLSAGLCGVAMLALVGCGSSTHLYSVDPPLPERNMTEVGPVILVTPPGALVGLRGRDIAYRVGGESRELRYYAHHFWAGSPTEMLEPLIVEALESSGSFSAVVGSTHSRLATVRLDTQIESFDLVVAGEVLEARVELRFMLLDLDQGAVLVTDVTSASARAHQNKPASGVRAIDEALTIVLADLSEASSSAVSQLQSARRTP